MKKYVLTLLAIILLAGTSCQEKIDIEKEKEAIKAVFETVDNAFFARDIDRLFECFIQDETTTGVAPGKDGLGDGWEEISEFYTQLFEDYPEARNLKSQNKNYKIKVYKDFAWAVYDEYQVDENDSLIRSGPRCIRFLEKVDDEWKLVLLSNLSREDTKEGEAEPEEKE